MLIFAFLTISVNNNVLLFDVYALQNSVSVKGTSVNVRSGPSTSYRILGTVSLGYNVSPLETVKDASGINKTWYKFNYNGQNAYIRSDFCKEMSSYVYDAKFEMELSQKGFPESYKVGLRDLHANYPNWIFNLENTNLDFDYAVSNELVGTRTLVRSNSISSYKSTAEGKYDWTTSTWPTFDGNAWVCASEAVTRCYMDPRNFLYDPYVFQFESQKFNANIHTLDGIQEMVKGTFLDSVVKTEGLKNENAPSIVNAPDMLIPSNSNSVIYPGIQTTPWDTSGPVIPILQNENEVYAFNNVYIVPNGPGTKSIEKLGPAVGSISSSHSKSESTSIESEEIVESFPFTYLPAGNYKYADLLYDACRQVNANPYVIVSMILQEQGKDGSDSVSGKNNKFKNIYNYGNINSFASNGLTSIENGLKYASETGSYNRPWNTKEKGIYGLCDFYANSYLKDGQDTFYLKKWNVQGDNLFKHQYMTNVAGAASEGQLLGNAYDEKMMQMPHEFKIPYYRNMPNENCPMPLKDGSPNNKLKKLEVVNYIITPTFNPDTSNYTLIIDPNVSSIYINAEAYDKKAAVGGIGNIQTLTSNTYAIIYCVAENGDIRQYNINIYKKGAEGVSAIINNENSSPIIINNNNIISPIGNINNNISNNEPNNISNYQPNIKMNVPVVEAPFTGKGPGL